MPHKHPLGPFTVVIREYRISPCVNTHDRGSIYLSRHRSPNGAAKRLASIIAGRSVLAKQIRKCISRDFAGQFLITCGDGSEHALTPFRKLISQTAL